MLKWRQFIGLSLALMGALSVIGFAAQTVDFNATPQNPIVGQAVTFTPVLSGFPEGYIAEYDWDFGDGTTQVVQATSSSSGAVTHSFDRQGTYRVTLTIKDTRGGETATTKTIIVGQPEASFTYAPSTPTTQDTVQFFGTAIPATDVAEWNWTFGDGSGGSQQNPTHKYAEQGTYTVTLIIIYKTGASATTSKSIQILNSPPVAPSPPFTWKPDPPKIGQAVTFTIASGWNDPDGHIVSVAWDLDGDGRFEIQGTLDSASQVIHTFSAGQQYKVTLKVTDDMGASTVVSLYVTVQSSPPVASFTFSPATPNTGQVVSFDASKSTAPDGSIILYEWDFNHDGKTDATGMAVTHSFAKAGVYPVTLKVTDNHGNIGAETEAVPVQMGGTGGANQPPIANFEFSPKTAHINEVVTFKATGCSDKDGTIVSYEWDFNNDGVYDATGTTVSHVFHRGGGQIVTLKVLDNDGAPGYKTEVVPVEFVRPTADFTYTPSNPEIGDVITFDGSKSSDADGRVEFYEWDFNNDGKTDATGMTVTHVFTSGGSKPVTLKVTDNDGVSDYITKTVFIRINNPPKADFTFSPAKPTTADTIKFTSKSTDTDGTIVAWQWEFGDGSKSSVQAPSHKYTAAKTYTVKLTVTDNDGATGSVTKQITVSKPANVAPVANFTFSPSIANVNKPVQFTDKSTDVDGTVTGWSWNFGDGGTSTAKNPTHTYTKIGTYVVTLVVTDNDGAKSRPVTKQIAVGQAGTEAVTHAYPNPATTRATISYILPTGATTPMIHVYDIAGNLVYEHDLTAGASTYSWDLTSTSGDPLPNGLYFYVITATDASGKAIRSPVFKLLIQR